MLQSCAAESCDVCAAETQSEKRALACALKRIIPVRLAWTVGRKQLNSTVLTYLFFLGKNLLTACSSGGWNFL